MSSHAAVYGNWSGAVPPAATSAMSLPAPPPFPPPPPPAESATQPVPVCGIRDGARDLFVRVIAMRLGSCLSEGRREEIRLAESFLLMIMDSVDLHARAEGERERGGERWCGGKGSGKIAERERHRRLYVC
jgi:hypothetical protein